MAFAKILHWVKSAFTEILISKKKIESPSFFFQFLPFFLLRFVTFSTILHWVMWPDYTGIRSEKLGSYFFRYRLVTFGTIEHGFGGPNRFRIRYKDSDYQLFFPYRFGNSTSVQITRINQFRSG